MRWKNPGRVNAAFAAIGLAAGLISLNATLAPALAKTPGSEYCFRGWCHRVSTIGEMDGMVGRRGYLTASYYDHCSRDRFNTCGLTSSGAIFHADDPDNAASPIFPDGTVILAYNPATKMAAVLRVTSAGPYHGDRTLDVSRGAAERLGFIKSGVAELIVTVLKSPSEQDARYKKLRVYEKVPGPIGKYDSFELAELAAVKTLAMQADLKRIAASESPAPPLQLAPEHIDNVSDVATAQDDVASEDAKRWVDAKLVTAIDSLETAPPSAGLVPLTQAAVIATREEVIDETAQARFWRFIEAARVAARSPSADQTAAAAVPALHRDETFFDRLKRFVEVARAQARRGRASSGSVFAAAAE